MLERSQSSMIEEVHRPIKVELEPESEFGFGGKRGEHQKTTRDFAVSHRRPSVDSNFVQTAAVARIPIVESVSPYSRSSVGGLLPLKSKSGTRTGGKSNAGVHGSESPSRRVVHCASTATIPTASHLPIARKTINCPATASMSSPRVDSLVHSTRLSATPTFANSNGIAAQLQRQTLPVSQPSPPTDDQTPTGTQSTTKRGTKRQQTGNETPMGEGAGRADGNPPVKAKRRVGPHDQEPMMDLTAQEYAELQHESWTLRRRVHDLEDAHPHVDLFDRVFALIWKTHTETKSELHELKTSVNNLYQLFSASVNVVNSNGAENDVQLGNCFDNDSRATSPGRSATWCETPSVQSGRSAATVSTGPIEKLSIVDICKIWATNIPVDGPTLPPSIDAKTSTRKPQKSPLEKYGAPQYEYVTKEVVDELHGLNSKIHELAHALADGMFPEDQLRLPLALRDSKIVDELRSIIEDRFPVKNLDYSQKRWREFKAAADELANRRAADDANDDQ